MGAEEHLAARDEHGDPAALADRLFRDMAGALELLTVYLGERLGLYQALHADGPGRWRAGTGCRPGTCLFSPAGYVSVLSDTSDVRYQAYKGIELARAGRQIPDIAEAMRSGGAPPCRGKPAWRTGSRLSPLTRPVPGYPANTTW